MPCWPLEVQAGCIIGPAAGDEDVDLTELCDRAVTALREAFEIEEAAEGTPLLLEDDPAVASVCGVALDAKQSQTLID